MSDPVQSCPSRSAAGPVRSSSAASVLSIGLTRYTPPRRLLLPALTRAHSLRVRTLLSGHPVSSQISDLVGHPAGKGPTGGRREPWNPGRRFTGLPARAKKTGPCQQRSKTVREEVITSQGKDQDFPCSQREVTRQMTRGDRGAQVLVE